MPIKRKDFENGKFKGFRNTDQSKHPVVVLLKGNVNLAFKVEEIAKRTKMNEDTIRSMLGVLKKEKAVVHKSPYFAWKKK